MRKKPTPMTDAEIRLFREAVQGVRPLKKIATKLPPSKKIPPKRKQAFFDDEEALLKPASTTPVTAQEQITYAISGIDPKYMRKLKRGQFILEAKLDLHGMTLKQARQAFLE